MQLEIENYRLKSSALFQLDASDANGPLPALAKRILQPVAAVVLMFSRSDSTLGCWKFTLFATARYRTFTRVFSRCALSATSWKHWSLQQGRTGLRWALLMHLEMLKRSKHMKSQEVPVLSKKNLKKHAHDLRSQLEPLHSGTWCVLTLHRLLDWCGTTFASLQYWDSRDYNHEASPSLECATSCAGNPVTEWLRLVCGFLVKKFLYPMVKHGKFA